MRDTRRYLLGRLRLTPEPVFSPGSDPGSILAFLIDNRDDREVWDAVRELMRTAYTEPTLRDAELWVGGGAAPLVPFRWENPAPWHRRPGGAQ